MLDILEINILDRHGYSIRWWRKTLKVGLLGKGDEGLKMCNVG